jgi:methylphosphotriester-DNA--protein-cysteine methyltransferase
MNAANDIMHRALRRHGLSLAEITRRRVAAFLPRDSMWPTLVRAGANSQPERLDEDLCLDAGTTWAEPIFIVDLAAHPSADVVVRHMASTTAARHVVWTDFSPSLTDDVLRLAALAPVDIIWTNSPDETTWLAAAVRQDDNACARACVTHALAPALSALPRDLAASVLGIIGGRDGGTRAADLTGFASSHRTAERALKAATRRSLGTLLRTIRHAIGWDWLACGGSVASAARRARYRNHRTYGEAFQRLVGHSPSRGPADVACADFVRRLLASHPAAITGTPTAAPGADAEPVPAATPPRSPPRGRSVHDASRCNDATPDTPLHV